MTLAQRARRTLSDIADQAGVSVSTVSKVLNGHTDVSGATRTSVQRLLDESGYQRPASRHQRRSDLIELVINDLDSAWGLSILNGVGEIIEGSGFSLVVTVVHSEDELVRRWFDAQLKRGSRGVIVVVTALSVTQRAMLRRRGIPFVFVDAPTPRIDDSPTISTNNFAGGYAATDHLIGLGHRRIAAIGGPPDWQCTKDRVAGYRAALLAAGITPDRTLVRHGNFRADGGLGAATELLDLPSPPTAVFAGNDQQATGTYEAAWRRGLRVPHNLSVVGFDDLDYSRFLAPPLTTVRQPIREMAALAAKHMLELLTEHGAEPLSTVLPAQLVVRHSTSPLRVS